MIPFGAAFFIYFLYMGIQGPYLSVHLREVGGVRDADVGWIFLALTSSLVVSGFFVGRLADTHLCRRRLQRITTLGAALSCSLLLAANGLPQLVGVVILMGLCLGAQIPMLDASAVDALGSRRGNYGRIRLFGTLGFLTSARVVGALRDGHPERIAPALIIAMSLYHLCCWLIPDSQAERRNKGEPRQRARFRELFAVPGIPLLFASAILHTTAFAARETFGALHFESIGLSGDQIGNLYAASMLAEIGMFLLTPRLLKRLDPLPLVVLAEGVSCLRWLALGFADGGPWLYVIALGHAATYGLWWSSMVHLMGSLVPDRLRTTGQALLSMGFAGGMGLGSVLAGQVREGADGFWSYRVAALVALLNLAMLRLGRRSIRGK